ncbi:MAG: F-type H+-transporting ATPase subunit b [Nocardioidaceae bacterium]|jgi:F-type H+-transporting ATPase subunit b|nr:F-type H+-transporting ATPase subunit b [Nocardioidaceae bacterium]
MTRPEAASNFLVPNATFVVELLIFVIILVLLGRYGLPRINKALTDRQQAIRREFEEAAEAKAKAEATEQEYQTLLAKARHEAARIREEAREEGAAIIAEMREQAQGESARILRHAHLQIEAERQQVVQQLRRQVGTMATTLAERIVGESLEDDERRNRTVERFIATLESQDSTASRGAS